MIDPSAVRTTHIPWKQLPALGSRLKSPTVHLSSHACVRGEDFYVWFVTMQMFNTLGRMFGVMRGLLHVYRLIVPLARRLSLWQH